MRNLILTLSALTLLGTSAYSQTIYSISNYPLVTAAAEQFYALRDAGGNVLPEGTFLQLGYFTSSSAANLFSGEFRPLAEFRIGDAFEGDDDFLPDGTFFVSVTFYQNESMVQSAKVFADQANEVEFNPSLSPFPTTNDTILALRWYTGTTATGNYNTASSASWLWKTVSTVPSGPDIYFDGAVVYTEAQGMGEAATGGSGLVNANSDFAATLVPEPGISMLVFSALGLVTLVRRRTAKVA
jgi:hypothetical protein